MIRTLRLLNLRRLGRQPLRTILAVVAVAAGVALAVSVLVVSGSLRRSWARYGETLGGPGGLRVVGASTRGGLDEAVTAKVEAVPGVGAAVPMVQAVTLADLRGPPSAGVAPAPATTIVALGVDCRIEQLIGPVGCSPEAVAAAGPASPPLISSRLASEATPSAVLRTDLGTIPLRGPLPAIAQLDRLNRGLVAIFPLPESQHLFGRPGAIDVIYVRPRPAVSLATLKSNLAAAIGPNNAVLAASAPPVGATLAITIFLVLLGMLSLFSLGVGGVLIYNTLSLSLEERRHDLAIAAALGASPNQLRAGVLAEAGLLGLAGGMVGIGGALLVARPITASLSDFVKNAIGLTATTHITARPVIDGLLLGVLLAGAASWQPARRAIRPDVAADLSGRERRQETAAHLHHRRALAFASVGGLGVLLTYVGARHGALETWQPTVAQLGMLLAVLGFLLAAGALAPILARAGQALVRGAGGPVRLGVSNLSRQGSRTGVMAVAVAAAVGTAVVIASFTLAVHDGILSHASQGADGRVSAATMPVNNAFELDARPSPDLMAELAATPGVGRVDRQYVLLVGNRNQNLVGVEAFDHNGFPFHVITGRLDRAAFDAGGVMVGPGLARDHGLRPGSTLTLPALHGMARLHVLGVWDYGDFNGHNVQMAPWLLNQLWGPQPPFGVSLKPSPGVSQTQLVAQVRAAHLSPYLKVQTPRNAAQDIVKSIGAQMAPFWVMQRTLLLVAFIAVLSTLLLIGLQRRREFGLLAAVGMAPRELGAMVVAEGAGIGVIGTVLGVTSGIAIYDAMLQDFPVLAGFHDPFRIKVSSIPLYGALAIVIVVLAAAWPAWRTSRLEAAAAVQYE